MKNLFSLLSILLILVFSLVIYSQTIERTTFIVDQSGTSTEVRNLSMGYRQPAKYWEASGKLVVITEKFDLLFPGSNVISIEYIGDGTDNKRKFEVSYYWMGEKKMISGNLIDISLTGQSDFGDFSISTNEIKQLRFSQVSENIKQKEEFHSAGYIILMDGTKLEFGDRITGTYMKQRYTLQRHTNYSYRYKKKIPQNTMDIALNQQRFEWATGVKSGHYKSIAFDRGKSQGLVEFKDLKSIEFQGKDNRDIIITLKNGNSTKAIINESKDVRDFDGITGVCGKGEFYIERKNIRIVYFN